jgi:hypothetical protein
MIFCVSYLGLAILGGRQEVLGVIGVSSKKDPHARFNNLSCKILSGQS